MTVISNANMNTMEDPDDGIAKENLCEKEYVAMEDGRNCSCLTCKPGFQAHTCNTMDPDTSFCEPCPDGQFMHNTSVLGRQERCRFWRKCDQPRMITSSSGGPTYDANCTCQHGYRLTSDSTACVFYDPRDIETTISTTMPSTKLNKLESNPEDASPDPAPWKVIGPVIAFSFLFVIVVIAIFLWRRNKKRRKEPKANIGEQSHLLETSIQDITDRTLHDKVLSECCRELEQKIGRDWKKLGRNVLDDRLDYALEQTRDSSIEEKVSEILKCWMQLMGHSATVRALFDALRSIGRKDLIDHLCHKIQNDPHLGKHFREDDEHAEV